MDNLSIEDALDRFRNGDAAATGELIRSLEPFLRGVVRRRLPARARNRFDSADIVQSAWAGVLGGLREGRWQFPDAAHFRAFLTRVALCRLYDRARRARGQTDRESPLAELADEPTGGEPRPSEHAQAAAVWQVLLAACPPEHRPVLQLRRLGHTCEEIAHRTGLHAGSVRRLLRQLARRAAFGDATDPEPRHADAV